MIFPHLLLKLTTRTHTKKSKTILLKVWFPDTLKMAKIVSIAKKGYQYNKENTRPIPILPTFNQYGFQDEQSTLSTTLNLTEFWYKNLNLKRKVGRIF